MDERLSDKIFRDFPWIDNQFEFAIGPGWFALLYNALKGLDRIRNDTGQDVHLLQVKEKLGGLRIYARGPEADYTCLFEAEKDSYHICEVCGKPGEKRNGGGWFRIRCDDHYPEKKMKKVNIDLIILEMLKSVE